MSHLFTFKMLNCIKILRNNKINFKTSLVLDLNKICAFEPYIKLKQSYCCHNSEPLREVYEFAKRLNLSPIFGFFLCGSQVLIRIV